MKRIRLLLMLAFALVATPLLAGVKPVVGIPDYNGTYGGTPNTGSTWDVMKGNPTNYTTLYRDNYNRTSGCAGERCGKHPGVDIAVPSGTKIVASLAGKVVQSVCDWNGIRGLENGATGFGGLIIVESTNPYDTTKKVYVSYAHLDDWNDYAVGKTVSQGTVIGKSGGSPTSGLCPGASGGAHLHFQVDKTLQTSKKPWYPTGAIEEQDIDFGVTSRTHNPIPFVTGWAYNFTFAQDGNMELWGCQNVLCNTSLSQLWMDGSSVYPYVGRSSWVPETSCTYSNNKPCSREITLDASIFKKATIKLSYACHTNFGYILYRNQYSRNWYSVKYYTQLGAATYTATMSILPDWRGIITDFMIQPGVGCTYYASPYHEYFVNQVYFTP